MKELNMNLELYEKSVNESEKPVLVEFCALVCILPPYRSRIRQDRRAV